MKRILSVLAALFLFMPVINAENAGSQDSLEIARKKKLMLEQRREARGYRRVMEADGFEILGTPMMEEKILRHMERRDSLGQDGFEYLGKGRSKSIHAARYNSLQDVAAEYVQRSVAAVKESRCYDLNCDIMTDDGWRKLYAAFEDSLTKKIRRILKESYCIRKTLSDGSHDVRIMCLIDEKEARKARLEAMEEAIAGCELGSEYVDYLKAQVEKPILHRYEDMIDL